MLFPQFYFKGAGCVMAEMWTRLPIMQGKVEQDQLIKIQKLCGGINPNTWPGVEKMPLWEKMTFPHETKFAKRIVSQRLNVFIKDNAALDLIEKVCHKLFFWKTVMVHNIFYRL